MNRMSHVKQTFLKLTLLTLIMNTRLYDGLSGRILYSKLRDNGFRTLLGCQVGSLSKAGLSTS